MEPILLAVWSLPILLLLIFLRVPIGLAMLALGCLGSWMVFGDWQPLLNQLQTLTYGQFSNHSLSVIPLFLLMGQFASLSGMSKAIFKATEAFIGHRKGGVAMAAVGACAGFGAICGSSMATAATMSQVALPELRRAGYANGLSVGTLAAGGTLGILIPPSIVLVIYAILAEQNIAMMFAAAVLPGILAALVASLGGVERCLASDADLWRGIGRHLCGGLHTNRRCGCGRGRHVALGMGTGRHHQGIFAADL